MLSAFTARAIVELKARDKSKIESVLADGDRVFVGLNTGSLRVYRVNEHDPEDEQHSQGRDDAAEAGAASDEGASESNVKQSASFHSIELLREESKFSRKPIQQLAIVKEASMLIALSDSHVAFYDLETYALSERLDKTKGALCFTTSRSIDRDHETGIPSIVSRMAVAVKRKIMLWTWQDSEMTAAGEEMSLPAQVKSLTWATSTKLVVGMDAGFSMVDLEAQTASDINRAATSGEVGGPNGTRFGAVSTSGINYMGMASWVPRPMAAKLSNDEIMLVKDVNSLFINSDAAPLPKRQVPWALAPEAIGYSYPYLLSLAPLVRAGLELRNPDSLTLLQTIPLQGATILHVPHHNISLAHAGKGFLVASDRCIWRMEAVGYGCQIDELIRGKRYDEALSFVNLIEDTLLLDKTARIQQIKTGKAHFLFVKRDFRESLELFSEALARPDQVISLYPQSIAGDMSQHGGAGEGDGSESVSGGSLEGRDLSIAINELRAFLAQTRVQLQKYINYDGTMKQPTSTQRPSDEPSDAVPPFAHFIEYRRTDDAETLRQKLFDAATLVDTTLFRAYMLVSPSLAGSLFRLENFCAADVVEDKLYASGRYAELLDFLGGKRMHEKALKLLEKFGKDEVEDENLAEFRGPQKTVQYLQQLPFELIDLILEYAQWPMTADPEAGLQIFLADTENAESLPRDQVAAFLGKFGSALVIRYLEHAIGELGDDTSPLHDQMAALYIMRLKAARPDAEEAQAAAWQSKLEAFLRTSRHFDKDKVLRSLPAQDERFYESRAIVLSKLSFHKEALRIYVYQMQEPRKAEEYCNQVYLALSSSTASSLDPDDAHRPQSIYTTLLSLYLDPPSTHRQNLSAALDLLSLHGARLPALSTLAALPESLPIKDLEDYFQARMRAANSIAREEAIMAALSRVENSAWVAELQLGDDKRTRNPRTAPGAGRNRRVMLGENRLCSFCNKRFSRATARVTPEGDVLHYSCTDGKQYAGIS